jgi:ferritin
MNDALNHQVALEQYSANLYLAMSSWCKNQGLEGSARFLSDHSKEELAHMMKLFDYINDTGATAIISAVKQPPNEFDTVEDVFQKTLAHEKTITAAINALVDLALGEKDYSTFNFLQWYVAEQHEEERIFHAILDKIKIIGTEGRGLFMIDREIGMMAQKLH